MTLSSTPPSPWGVSNLYLNHARWVMDCSADDCEAVLLLGRQTCECRDESVCDHPAIPCGHSTVAEFPDDMKEIDRLTMLRPRRNRNWTSETLDELKAENLLQGVGI